MRKALLICFVCLLSVEIGLAATGSVTGRVTDISTGGSISGASVKVGGYSATTTSRGYYPVSGLVAGSYTVTASHSGYFAESVATSVTAGATSTANVRLPTGGILAGTVTGSNGAALANAAVTVSGGKVATTKTMTTNSAGGYNTSWVPVGTYTITVAASGYNTQSKTATVYTGTTTTANLSMVGSTTTSTTAVVTGRVTNISTGNSISGAKVTLGASTTYADSSGIYRFSNLAAGTYSMTADHSGYLSVSKSVTATSGTTSTLNFQLATAGIITGTVTTSSGALLPGATVSLSGGLIATTVTRTTNSSGYYSSSWIPVGTYKVTVSNAGYTTQSKSATANTGATTTLNVALASSTSSIAHQATVKWAASISTVAGYNVYRSAVSGGPYTRMNSATNTYTSYADPTVSAGQTYYYVVTSVGANGLEGGYSSQVKAVIPTP